jgi:chaperonin GroEL (HSP60 family)
MAELKTKKTEMSVEAFLTHIADKEQQEDSRIIIDLMQKATKSPPKMW